MKANTLALAFMAGAFFFAGNSFADAGADLAKAKGCLGCHTVDKKKVGPAFKDIAAKRAGKADELVTKIKTAKGHPKVKASDEEVKQLVDWVLSQK